VRTLGRLHRRSPLAPSTVVPAALLLAAGFALLGPELRSGATTDAAAHGGAEDDALDAVTRGAALYRRDCASCHGVSGEGTPRGTAIADRGTSSVYYALATGRMPIAEPASRIERRESHYTDDEIDEIVAYTATFVDGPAEPQLERGAALSTGGELYRLHCAACHGATGIGGAQAFSREAPSVLHASERDVAAAVVAGPGGMPSFRTALDDAEIAAVADYVGYLQHPVRRGAAIPGGRVGEGLIAWLVGVIALLACATWAAGRSGGRP
jgi:ubiquinol-cytochrome c reductase cytochrome c subunit